MSKFVEEFSDPDVQPSFGGLFRSKDVLMTTEDFFVDAESGEFEEFVGGETRSKRDNFLHFLM